MILIFRIQFPISNSVNCRGERGELAPHVFLLTWLLPTYGDDISMLHIYQSEYQELMAAKPVLVWKLSWQTIFESHEYTFLITVILYFRRNVASVVEVFNFVNKV